MSTNNAMAATRLQPIVSQSLPLDSIICGDNCDVLGTFPRECIDLVVTSPPYDDLRIYGGHSWDFYGVAWQLKRVLKPGGIIVWVVNDKTEDGSETGTSADQARHFRHLGLKQHDTMIYQKAGCPFPETTRYYPVFEFMFVFSKGKPLVTNLLADSPNAWAGQPKARLHSDRQQDGSVTENSAFRVDPGRTVKEFGVRENVWRFSVGRGNTTTDGFAFDHPAMFPEKLARDHILSWSNEGDIVLDPFNGSGTTTKMARLMGRRFIGIDVNESYCEIARKRLAQRLLDFGDAG